MTNRASLTAATLVLAAGWVVGCGDRDSASSKAIDNSSRDVHAISYGVTEPSMEGTRATTYQKVSSDLDNAGKSGTAGEKSAAGILIAQAQASMGAGAAAEAASMENAAMQSITTVDAQLSQWRMRSAAASAADSYDPAAEITGIAKSKAEKQTLIKGEQDHRTQVQTQLTDLQGKAKAKMDGAAAKEDDYARRMQAAVKLSATEAAPLVEEANKIKREADALRLDGSKFDAQAQVVAPVIKEIDAVIAQLTNQMKDLDATVTALNARKEAARAEATEARAGAGAAGGEVQKGVDGIAKQREAIDGSYSKALGFYNKAAAAAKEASQMSPTSAKASLGDIQMSIAELHWGKSQGLRAYAGMLESLVKSEPALPGRADFDAKAKAAREASKQELEATASALDAANSAFGGASGRMTPDGKERIQKLQDLLTKALAVSRDDGQTASTDLQALSGRGGAADKPAEKPADASAAAPAGAPADPALVAAVDALLNAAREGRQSDMMAMMYIPDSAKAAIEPLKDLSTKMERVDKAFKTKFGKTFAEAAASNPMLGAMVSQFGKMGGMDPAKLKTLKASDLTIAANGDAGSASGGGLAAPLQFKKVDGKWLFYDKSIEAAGPMLAAQAGMMGPLSQGFDEFAGEVEAGKYPDANAAVMAFMAKMQALMGGGHGGTKPPPGGGG